MQFTELLIIISCFQFNIKIFDVFRNYVGIRIILPLQLQLTKPLLEKTRIGFIPSRDILNKI